MGIFARPKFCQGFTHLRRNSTTAFGDTNTPGLPMSRDIFESRNWLSRSCSARVLLAANTNCNSHLKFRGMQPLLRQSFAALHGSVRLIFSCSLGTQVGPLRVEISDTQLAMEGMRARPNPSHLASWRRVTLTIRFVNYNVCQADPC